MKSARCYSSIFALLLVMILLFAAHVQAQTGPIANLINSRQGIAYNANARTVSSNYTVQAEDHTVLVNAASAAVTVTLPAASQKRYPYVVIKKIDATNNAVTVDGASTQRIDGSTTVVLNAQYQQVILQGGDTSWSILSGGSALRGDVTLTTSSTGGNLGDANVFSGGINIKQVPFGTMTNGSTESVSWMDDTPAADFSAVTVGVAPTDTEDSSYARVGSKSLKLAWPSTSVAGDGVTATLTSDNLEANESVGMWLYVSEAIATGDLTLVLTDDGGARTFSIPAVTTPNVWAWVEVDISSLAGGTGDAITAYSILLSTAGASAHAAFTTYVDGVWKWDAADELALGVDVLDQPGSICSILTLTKANTGTHDQAALVEQTDFFIARRSGNDSIVQTSNQSTKAGVATVLYK